MSKVFKKILIANRGEIAVRIMRACREMGIATVAVYSEADVDALHVRMADEAYLLGPAPSNESYLRTDKIFEVLEQSGADAVHPGYGFLSENAEFAQALTAKGICLIGPSPEAMTLMGSKIAAKETMEKAGVPTVPGYFGEDQSIARLQSEAQRIGFPLLVKASAGGGGKGMRVVQAPDELSDALAAARREALNAFGDNTVFLERYFEKVRHIEFQIMADHQGNTVHIFERECSIQRRHQKIVEESPSIALSDDLRQRMGEAAIQAAKAVQYTNAGTVEMLLDAQGEFYFLEMNTRLQVEHPVTEMISGVDLVKTQITVAAGQPLPFNQSDLTPRGHAIEVRIYAEDPDQNFMPTTGTVAFLKEPSGEGIRVDSALYTGYVVTPYYDPMLSKLIVHGRDREQAIEKMQQALKQYVLMGLTTNLNYLQRVLHHDAFAAGDTYTYFVNRYAEGLLPPQILPPEIFAAVEKRREALAAKQVQPVDNDPYSPWKKQLHFSNFL
jgi:3-methylcrotonyl-CoA carboxylase alpha subunit